jgi:glycosyltransferase involved in cell wall biosynthesis
VDFLGYVDHESIPALYDRSDIFVHPSICPEPFGRTILEAMQFSLPVVATNLGGPAEVIPQEECLCDPADPRDMAEKIIFVDERKEQIGEHNRQYVDYKYSPESVVPKIIDVYERVRGTSR